MKVVFLGDSITEGAGASDISHCYVNLVGKIMNIKVVNKGISGTRIAKQKSQSENPRFDLDFLGRVNELDLDADFVFVMGGTNDYGRSGDSTIGNINSLDEYSFYGAMNKLVKLLTERFDRNKICFLLPIKRYKGYLINKERKVKTASLRKYVSIMKEVLSKNNIEYIDLFNNCIPYPKTDKNGEFTIDGLHPNDIGHKRIAEKVCEYLKNKFGE